MANRELNSHSFVSDKRLIIAIFPTLFGGLIYLTYRTDSLRLFNWFKQIGLSSFISYLRKNSLLQDLWLPNWVKFSLPDALWLFSFTYILLLLWNFKINQQSAFWIFSAPMIGILSEIGQFFGFIPGTFDIIDLFLLIITTILPFLLTLDYKKNDKKQ